MRSIILTFMCLSIAVAVAAPVPKPDNRDAKALAGEWSSEKWESEGRVTTKNEVRFAPRLSVTDSAITLDHGTRTYPMSYTLDCSKTPATIDLIYTVGPDKGKVVRGIYEVNADTLKLCLPYAGEDRPKSFTTKEGDHQTTTEYSRSKAK